MASVHVKTAEAFCPAHITGFFKVHTAKRTLEDSSGRESGSIWWSDADEARLHMGSTGAGFSLEVGVTTRVSIRASSHDGYDANNNNMDRPEKTTTIPHIAITTSGAHASDDTRLSHVVIQKFLKLANMQQEHQNQTPRQAMHKMTIHVDHLIQVPVGYGLGCSGAAALSLAYALDGALGTKIGRIRAAKIAHISEIECGTGYGDVLASYHGGFEVRTSPGAPGIGKVKNIAMGTDAAATVMCMAPMSTSSIIREDLTEAGILGEKMTEDLIRSRDYEHFQKMSLEFAERAGVVTPKMRDVIDELHGAGVGCGVALFGETIFCMTDKKSYDDMDCMARVRAMHETFQKYPECAVLNSRLDQNGGARMLLPLTLQQQSSQRRQSTRTKKV